MPRDYFPRLFLLNNTCQVDKAFGWWPMIDLLWPCKPCSLPLDSWLRKPLVRRPKKRKKPSYTYWDPMKPSRKDRFYLAFYTITITFCTSSIRLWTSSLR